MSMRTSRATQVFSGIGLGLAGFVLGVSVLVRAAIPQATAAAPLDPGFHQGAAGLTPSERAGREIWFKATAGNERFHTYVFQQRLGVLIDWGKVLGSTGRNERFETWGLINDPDCCTPGDPNCPKKSLDETVRLRLLPGRRRRCSRTSARRAIAIRPVISSMPRCRRARPISASRACDMKFGTSTGALGFRKFPNPRFQADQWRTVMGSMGSWEAFGKPLADKGADSRANRLLDGSIEPPFLIGMSCGACHIAFKPTKPPKDPAHPLWENIDGLVGNQYTRSSEILASGMSRNTLEWQIFAHARPGTVDTSAVPNDQVSNPGTMNPLINLPQRPKFDEEVTRWRRAQSCPAGAADDTCWCEPGRTNKCWARGTQREPVHHILKGGEDSIGALEAIQRVYFNIGSCSEQCWVNHITDLRQADPEQRGFGQTPFDIGQCRRDCPDFRAIEDRLPDLADFLFSARPAELYVARGLPNRQALIAQLDRSTAPARSSAAAKCSGRRARECHSSQPDPESPTTDFYATVAGRPDLRIDFLSNEKAASRRRTSAPSDRAPCTRIT